MIASMKPPYKISPKILNLITSISEKIGEVNATYLNKQSPTLRKQNKIKTIHSSLQIEGNTLTQDQITALIENKRIIGPQKDVIEVLNAIKVYEHLERFNWITEKSFLEAHRWMMEGLVVDAGKYRTKGVGIVQGTEVAHIAPPATNVPYLMKELFAYLEREDEIPLIKSCVFHYEMEFIHPFLDGNGRMGRLWQTVILIQKYPVFEFLPFETLISKTQADYYRILSLCDKTGNSTLFIEYMLDVIDQSLAELLTFNNRTLTANDRIEYFIKSGKKQFNRKDYMNVFKHISSATATRDLNKAIELNFLEKEGEGNKTFYKIR